MKRKGNNIILDKFFTLRGRHFVVHSGMNSLLYDFSYNGNVRLNNDVSQIRMELLCLNS